MIFITFNSKLHHFDSFWTFKTQNTIYNYIYLENYKYKNLKEAVEIYKNQIKNHGVKQFVSFTKYNGMLQAKQMTNVLFYLSSIVQCTHHFHIVW